MSNNSSFGIGFWLFMILAAAIFGGQLFFPSPDSQSEAPAIDDSEYAPPVKAKPKPRPKPRPARTTSAPSPSSYWSGSSNGHTWNRATSAQKNWICNKMASVSNKGATAGYYMNFFNNFYGSAATDSTSMSDASRLAEAGF